MPNKKGTLETLTQLLMREIYKLKRDKHSANFIPSFCCIKPLATFIEKPEIKSTGFMYISIFGLDICKIVIWARLTLNEVHLKLCSKSL